MMTAYIHPYVVFTVAQVAEQLLQHSVLRSHLHAGQLSRRGARMM